MQPEFQTKHNLPFEVAPWLGGLIFWSIAGNEFLRYRVGTCSGLWSFDDEAYNILVVDNNNPGNGHFEDVLEWFEHSAKRDGKKLRVLECWNLDLKRHLIAKRGFTALGRADVEKSF